MSATGTARETGEGASPTAPAEAGARGWKDIAWRLWAEYGEDRIALIAAGATFYLLLALFPALAAFVAIYGFVADPLTIADHIAFLGGVLPTGGVELISTQLKALASQDAAALSFAFIFGLLFAIWSANSGIKTLFEALNVAYDATEKRSFLKLNLVSLLFTLGAILIGILFIASVGIVPAVLALAGLGSIAETLISLARWPVLFLAAVAGITILYRYGPCRRRTEWRWVDRGARARHGALAARLDPVLLVPDEFRRLQRHLRLARRGDRLHDVDLDLGGDPAGLRRAERATGARDHRRSLSSRRPVRAIRRWRTRSPKAAARTARRRRSLARCADWPSPPQRSAPPMRCARSSAARRDKRRRGPSDTGREGANGADSGPAARIH